MDQLAAMRLFVRVADRGSFSAVAREMGGAQSQVSRQVAQLERALGVHLLQRTTRAVLLTDEGRLYLEFARRAIAEADEGAALVRAGAQQVHGRLRMALPLAVFRHLLFEPLQALMQAHPALQL
ncbi:MAG: LysR family transcriptional regulator, partial [Burkholderiales bacterium]|nr:LysR family transcriptional regulator [Burkholderiales bacterium]